MLHMGRGLTALLLVLGVAAPGLDNCLCGLFGAAEPEDCCAGFEEGAPPPAGPVLDDGPCCCCSVEPEAARGPAPSAFASTAHLEAGPTPEATPSIQVLLAFPQPRLGLERPPAGPDPSPPAALLVRRTIVLII